MIPTGQDSLKTRSTLEVGGKSNAYFSLPKAAETLGEIDRLPFSMKVLLEHLLRFEDVITVTRDDLQAMADCVKERRISREIQYRIREILRRRPTTAEPTSSARPVSSPCRVWRTTAKVLNNAASTATTR